jgi:hypothetical protein
MENISELYYEKLRTSTSPGVVLATFYCELYDRTATRSEIIMFNRLLRVFGRFTVFSSVVDMGGSYPEWQENVYPLLYTICKRKFELAHDDAVVQSRESLTRYINGIRKGAVESKKKKLKIPPAEGLDKDA